MKRIFAHMIIAGSVLMTLAGAAQAQLGQPTKSSISIKVGGYFPSNSSARDNGGSTQLSAGIDYAVPSTGGNSTTSLPSVYFDYNGGSKNGGHVNTYGVGFAVRSAASSSSAPAKMGFSPYVGIGTGYYEVQVKNNTVKPSVSGSGGSFGGKIFAGLNLSSNFFIEANYQLISSRKGVNPSGFGVQLGARF
ncbi:MAG TPA: outer membrane beta-barrel protein [Capsulimonadaceae bacterium]|nr:outer membrane beta-barrel protein [Capsulimonadaceae bacterium]